MTTLRVGNVWTGAAMGLYEVARIFGATVGLQTDSKTYYTA